MVQMEPCRPRGMQILGHLLLAALALGLALDSIARGMDPRGLSRAPDVFYVPLRHQESLIAQI
jgi:uncharacterized protein (DUF924 family)